MIPSSSCTLVNLKTSEEMVAKSMAVVYTAMHGVGCPFVQRAFDAFGHTAQSLRLVAAQCEADPKFPTVAFPNPETLQWKWKCFCFLLETNQPKRT